MAVLIVFPGRESMWANAPDVFREALGGHEDVRFAHGLEGGLAQADGVDVLAAFFLNGAVLRACGGVGWVQGLGAGVDGIADMPELAPGVWVTSMRGLQGAAVSEAVIAALLALSRGQATAWSDQTNRRWAPRPSRLLQGQVLGVVGTGVIAQALAARARPFGMRIVGFSAEPRPLDDFDAVFARATLSEQVGQCDALVLLTPLTLATRGLVDADVFSAMKPQSVLVNVGRGGLVDEAALAEALGRGALAGAALDVFETEPLPADSPLWTAPNLLVTPHSAGRHLGYVRDAARLFASNLACWRAGAPDRMVNIARRPAAG